MPDIADDAQSEEQLMIERGLTTIRVQFVSQSAVNCQQCGDHIPERRRQLLPGVKTCVHCQERTEFYRKVGSAPHRDSFTD